MITLERRLSVIARTTTRLNTQMRELEQLRGQLKRAEVVMNADMETSEIQRSTNKPTLPPDHDGNGYVLDVGPKAGADCLLDYRPATVTPHPLRHDAAAELVSAGSTAR